MFSDPKIVANFSGGRGPIILQVECFRNEDTLLDCNTNIARHCTHFNDVGVSCGKVKYSSIRTT